jgi:hypothetical protein
VRLLLLPFLAATWLWQWAAPAIPDPGLRYVGLFILPQLAISHTLGLLLPLATASGASGLETCGALFCCCCLPMLILAAMQKDEKGEKHDVVPPFFPQR